MKLDKIKFVEVNGTEHDVTGQPGQSVMEAAIWASVPGIEAVCGGAMACSTCLVHIDKEWRDKLPESSAGEIELMALHRHVTPDSRLSCQLRVGDTLDGIVVRMPPSQE